MRGERLKRANLIAKRFLKQNPWFYDKYGGGIVRKTRVRCSNPACCGNRRRLSGHLKDGLTMQEKRKITPRPPRYDEIYWAGLEWLDTL